MSRATSIVEHCLALVITQRSTQTNNHFCFNINLNYCLLFLDELATQGALLHKIAVNARDCASFVTDDVDANDDNNDGNDNDDISVNRTTSLLSSSSNGVTVRRRLMSQYTLLNQVIRE